MGCLVSDQDIANIYRGIMIQVGLTVSIGVYGYIAVHLYAFHEVICPLLQSRLGERFGMLWLAVGLAILFNIVFNHFWAMVIKPGSTRDLRLVE